MKPTFLAAGAFLAAILSGCTTTWKAPVTPISFQSNEKLALRVQLVLTEELREAEWSAMVSPMDRARIPIGEDLARNAEALARAIFSKVSVGTDAPAPNAPDLDAILTPKLITFERTQPTTIFGQQTTTLVLEWRLTSVQGDTLWVDTLKGEKTQKMSSNPRRSATEQVDAAFSEVFAKSYASISSAPEVRRLSQQ